MKEKSTEKYIGSTKRSTRLLYDERNQRKHTLQIYSRRPVRAWQQIQLMRGIRQERETCMYEREADAVRMQEEGLRVLASVFRSESMREGRRRRE